MSFSVLSINSDGSAILLSRFADCASAVSFISSQGPGNFRIEYGDNGQASVMEVVSQ